VETSDQLRQLAMLECEYGQGYYFSRPLDVEGAAKLLGERHTYHIELPALDSYVEEGDILAA